MNKNLHDIDKLFLDALDKNAELPSASAKEKLMAALDKQDAESNRRMLIWWKRTSFLLFFLLAVYVLVDSSLLKTRKGSGRENALANRPVPVHKTETDKNLGISSQTTIDEAVSKNTASTDGSLQWSLAPAETGNIRASVSLLNPGSPSFYLSPVLGVTDKEQDQQVVPDSNSPGIASGYMNPEHIGRLSYPFLLTERSSKRIPAPLKLSIPAAPRFSLQKSRGNIFRPYWEFSFFSSYDLTGYRLDSDDPVTISNIKHNEVHEPSFSAGVLLTRQFRKHWGVQTGLIYSYTGIGISPQKVYAFQDPAGDISYKYITSSGYAYIRPAGGNPVVGDSLTVESKHQLKTVNVPLLLRYRLGNNKLSIAPGAGVEAGFITSAKSEVELTDASNHETATVNKLNGTKKFYWSAIANVELRYKLTGKTSVMLQPSYRQALSPITKNNVVETFPRGFGIRAGITIRL